MKVIILGSQATDLPEVISLLEDQSAQITVYEQGELCSQCLGILSYYLEHREKDVISIMKNKQQELETKSVKLCFQTEALDIDTSKKCITLQNKKNQDVFTEYYDTLIGADSVMKEMEHLPGANKIGVQTLKTATDVLFLQEMTKTPYVHEVTIIGGDFAGITLAKTFLKMGRKVRIIESNRQLLCCFQKDVSERIQKKLEQMGISVHLGETVTSFEGNSFVERTRTNKDCYDTDLAMLTTDLNMTWEEFEQTAYHAV